MRGPESLQLIGDPGTVLLDELSLRAVTVLAVTDQ